MRGEGLRLRRVLLPAATFAVVVTAHFVWVGLFPESDDAQEGWTVVATDATPTWLERYLERGDYWLGYCYALPLAFGVAALQWYGATRACQAKCFAIGGLGLSGVLAATACFLLGCCGSPMLGVYLSLFGAAFLPFAKPLVAGITTLLICASYLWMRRLTREPKDHQPEMSSCCGGG